jgi:hypothetical protein
MARLDTKSPANEANYFPEHAIVDLDETYKPQDLIDALSDLRFKRLGVRTAARNAPRTSQAAGQCVAGCNNLQCDSWPLANDGLQVGNIAIRAQIIFCNMPLDAIF